MPTPLEYHNKIDEMGIDGLGYTLDTKGDYVSEKFKMYRIENRLLELKIGVQKDIDLARKKYQEDVDLIEKKYPKKSWFASMFTSPSKSNKLEELKRKDARLVKSYREVEDRVNSSLVYVGDRIQKTAQIIENFKVREKSRSSHTLKSRASAQKKVQSILDELAAETKKPKRINYQEYILSPQWRKKAEAAKQWAGQRCQVCNKSRDDVQLDAHHRTYERLGNELDSDITVLCRDCHQLYEDQKRESREKPKAKGMCIRCGKGIVLKPTSTYCRSCFQIWKRFGNWEYEEHFCHICGVKHQTTRQKPACYGCYLKHRNSLEFPS